MTPRADSENGSSSRERIQRNDLGTRAGNIAACSSQEPTVAAGSAAELVAFRREHPRFAVRARPDGRTAVTLADPLYDTLEPPNLRFEAFHSRFQFLHAMLAPLLSGA